MRAGKLDRRVQIRRYTLADDGFQKVKVWQNHGAPIWASKMDVSDGEKMRADGPSASLTARFEVRSSVFSRCITPKDAISYGGVEFDILGIKEVGRNNRLEITAGGVVNNDNS